MVVIAGTIKPNSQLEIFSIIERKKRQEIKKNPTAIKILDNQKKVQKKIKTFQDKIEQNITDLNNYLVKLENSDKYSPYVEKQIIETKSKLKINWLGNNLIKKLNNTYFEPIEITNDIDVKLNKYIFNRNSTNSKQDTILDKISEINKKMQSEITTTEKRELFLQLITNILSLQKTLYDTYVSRKSKIGLFNEYFKKLLEEY